MNLNRQFILIPLYWYNKNGFDKLFINIYIYNMIFLSCLLHVWFNLNFFHLCIFDFEIYTQHYLENLPERNPEQLGPKVIEACKKYILKCAELSWLMVIQDPPMCMEWQFTGSEFKSETMRSFTKSGDQVQFVVWPALYLHDNGALVAKAIVQGMKTEKKGRKNQK